MKRTNKKRLLAFLMALVFSFTLTGCKSTGREEVDDESSDNGITIGFSVDSLVVERWEKDRDIFVTKAGELGADVNFQNASGSIETQKKQIGYLIDRGVDVIVIVAGDSEGFSGEVEDAHKKGIKVIAYDRMLTNTSVDLYISFDNTEVGRLMGETFAGKLKTGANVMMVNGPTTDNNVKSVSEGFMEVAENNRWNITDISYTEGWKQELAYDYINEHIDIAREADAIMCGNDAIAGQVISALSENRIAGDILVAGQDADLDACQRVVEKSQFMTVYKPIDTLAETAANFAVRLANGDMPEDLLTENNGRYDVPCIYVTPYAVTIDNIDEMIIDSGFHMKNDVYLNVTQ
ncbi:MAG: substrate-binding domain-containing protein [Lachnospiraceae bacterium]|nr:substrate-binding domain-containing protein [Lachnospiraceae bacterium]